MMIPGPGSYNSSKNALFSNVNGGSMARTGRDKDPYGKSATGSVPGPGQYGSSKLKRDGFKGGYSFGQEKRGTELKGNGVPGPGQYSKQKAKVILSDSYI